MLRMAKPNILLRAKRKKALESFQAKRYDEALALFQNICQADRLDADARMSCGAIAGLRGDHAQAEAYCRQALAIEFCQRSEMIGSDVQKLIQSWHGVDRMGYAITPRFAPTSSEAQLRGAKARARPSPLLCARPATTPGLRAPNSATLR